MQLKHPLVVRKVPFRHGRSSLAQQRGELRKQRQTIALRTNLWNFLSVQVLHPAFYTDQSYVWSWEIQEMLAMKCSKIVLSKRRRSKENASSEWIGNLVNELKWIGLKMRSKRFWNIPNLFYLFGRAYEVENVPVSTRAGLPPPTRMKSLSPATSKSSRFPAFLRCSL